MKLFFKLTLVLVFVFSLIPQTGYTQYSSTKVKTKHQKYTDSLKNVEYNYVFPILGQGAYKKGFDIPYPVGIMANSIWMTQDIVFSDFQLGFEGDNVDFPLTPMDDIIKFGKNTNDSQSYTVRPDIWVLPFLNVYGLFGYGSSTTEVKLVAPFELTSVVEQEFATNGVGIMAAGGVGPVWISADYNWTWSKPQLLDKSVLVNVMGLRVGHTFVFKNKPQSNLVFWVGAMHLKMSSETSGKISIKEALPQEFWDNKDQFVDDYDAWKNLNYDDLSRAQKKAIDDVIDPIFENINNRDGDGIVSYAMDKQTKQLWNGTVGGQYQINKHWQFRTEAGFIGNRKSFMLSFNYRFLL